MLGATLAGLAFGVAGTAAAHAIQYPSARSPIRRMARGRLSHALCHDWNAPLIRDELAQIAHAAGLGGPDEVIPALVSLFERIGIPARCGTSASKEDRIDWVAEQTQVSHASSRTIPAP